MYIYIYIYSTRTQTQLNIFVTCNRTNILYMRIHQMSIRTRMHA